MRDDLIMRGTTPVNIFETDIDLTGAEVIYITYKQGRCIVLEKSLPDIDVYSDRLEVSLSQEDTLLFGDQDVTMQIRARFPGNPAVASDWMRAPVGAILKDGVI